MHMTTITLNNREYVFVRVPDDAYGFYKHYASEYLEFYRGKGFIQIDKIKIGYDGIFIANTTDMTEEQAWGMVDDMDSEGLYRDYTAPHIHHAYTTALYSFKSLLQHHSITGRHAIIEKI